MDLETALNVPDRPWVLPLWLLVEQVLPGASSGDNRKSRRGGRGSCRRGRRGAPSNGPISRVGPPSRPLRSSERRLAAGPFSTAGITRRVPALERGAPWPRGRPARLGERHRFQTPECVRGFASRSRSPSRPWNPCSPGRRATDSRAGCWRGGARAGKLIAIPIGETAGPPHPGRW
jgi:hypothetical protein